MDRCACACGESVVRRGGVNVRPRASMTQSPLSSSSRSMGVMRTILPSSTSTKTGPPVVQFVSRCDFTHSRKTSLPRCNLAADRGRRVPPNAN